MKSFSATSANGLWTAAIESLKTGAGWRREPSRCGVTHELLHATLHLLDPKDRWIVARQPAMNPAFAFAELVWIALGRNDARFLNAFFPKLPGFQGTEDTYHGAYGYRLRRLHVDQLRIACDALRTNPTSRQVVLQIWDSTLDLPAVDGIPNSPDVPCNVVVMLKVRDGTLYWSQISRSSDLWRGLPYDLALFTHLHELLASWIGAKVGTHTFYADSLHVYDHDAGFLQSHDSSHTDIPFLGDPISYEATIDHFERIAEVIDAVIDTAIMPDSNSPHLSEQRLPRPFRDMLLVMVAELARRRHEFEVSDSLVQLCQGNGIIYLWQRWRNRIGNRVRTE